MSKEKEVISLNQALRNTDFNRVFSAINSDNCKIVIDAKYPNTEVRDYTSDSLALAIATGDEKIVSMVLQKSQELEVEAVVNDAKYLNGKLNYFHNTIYKAAENGNKDIIDLALKAGADPKTLENQHPRKLELIDRKAELDNEKNSRPNNSPNSINEVQASQISQQNQTKSNSH
jgi:hypothetical protein